MFLKQKKKTTSVQSMTKTRAKWMAEEECLRASSVLALATPYHQTQRAFILQPPVTSDLGLLNCSERLAAMGRWDKQHLSRIVPRQFKQPNSIQSTMVFGGSSEIQVCGFGSVIQYVDMHCYILQFSVLI